MRMRLGTEGVNAGNSVMSSTGSRSAKTPGGWRMIAGVAVVAVLAASSTGCKSLLKKKNKDAGLGTTSTTPLTGQDLADDQMQEKLDEYIKCLNTLSTPIQQSRHRYLAYIPKTGPKGTEQYADVYKLSPGTTANCSAGVSRSKLMPPPNAKLEAAGTEYSLAASDIDRQINEASSYFEMKSFKDDKWAKGKLMHPRLMAGWDRFSKADKNLHDTLDGITKPLAQRTLQRIEREEGKKFRYNRKHVLIESRELIEASDPVGEDGDIDFQLFGAEYTEFEKALDDLQAYGSTHRSELSNSNLAPSWPLAESNYDDFVKAATEFKKASKEFWRCLRDAPAKAKTPSGKIDMDKMGNCGSDPAWKTGDEVIKKYNEFIRTSNSHQFP